MTEYEANLQKIIKQETVSELGQTDLTKFYDLHKLFAELFPSLWKTADVEVFDGSLLIRWPGKSSEKLPVMFMNHQDVVDPNGKWDYDPFGGEIIDGRMYGRGTIDTKTGLWAMFQAADELIREGFVPEQDIYFESACNEEITGEGAEKISEILKERGIRFSFVLDEGMGFCGNTASIALGEKGCTELKFIARSAGGHASRPPKNSGLVRLGRFMAAVDDELDTIFPVKTEEKTNTPQQTTIAFTVAEGSQGRNVLPTEAYVIASMRSSHHQTVDGSIRSVTEFAEKYGIEVEILDRGFTSAIADPKGASFKKLENAVKRFFPGTETAAVIMAGATDARYMSKVCDGPIRFSPLQLTAEQQATIHSVNENISLDALPKAVGFFKYLMQA